MADKPPTAMPPASEPFPGSRTPGWNDPPTLAYNPMSATGAPGRPRVSLNKRVAYPLQGSVTSAMPTTKPTAVVLPNQASFGGLPPPPPPMAVNAPSATIMQPVAVVHPMSHSSNQQESIDLPQDALAVIFRSLNDRVSSVQESVNVRREEIERRLSIIEQLWHSGNLSPAVKQKIYNLSLAVQRNEYNEAMELYTSLVANHANECTSWAVTLRHIVLTIAPPPPQSAAATPVATVAGSDSNNLTGPSATESLVSTIPTMSVTAMPRSAMNSIGEGGGGNEDANLAAPISRVQHI